MPADEMWRNPLQPLAVINQPQVVLELDVAEVVPITNPRVVPEVSLEGNHLAFCRHILVAGSRFNGQLDADFLRPRGQGAECFHGAVEIQRRDFLAFFNECQLGLDEVAIVLTAIGHHLGEWSGPFLRIHWHGAHVQHQILCLKLRCQIERAQGHIHRPLAIEGAVRGELVGVGRIDHDLDRRREKIMNPRAAEKPALVGFLNARKLGDGHAMRQFNVRKAEIDDFLDH